MIKKFQGERFEFVLYINKHIICQRWFNINDYNENSIYSLEIKELMDRLIGMNNGDFGSMGIIPKFLKHKAIDFLWSNYKPFYPQKDVQYKNLLEKEDNFEFEIRVDKVVVAQSTFSGNYFPKKSWDKIQVSVFNDKYQLDIKEIIPVIISEIKYGLSQKNYTTKYANVQL